ncbi:MATE family efflux transporter [Ruminococcaceae bacterium OttesenSCG-928-L11]|nr:MATE family efflux transporter [Ruminococcaceae bacterium OttesenSCG-928-L11]
MSTESTSQSGNILGTEPVGKLLARYAIPSVISMLVNSIYNIVDQIFIGHGVGYLGNSATTVAFPVVVIMLGISLLIGNGSASLISLELGKGQSDNAKRLLGNAVSLILGFGIAIAAIVTLFLQSILTGLAATPDIMPYAVDYLGVIALGAPLSMITTGITSVIRADGSPRYSMVATMSGAILNVILDPIFIFVFGMGVRGAAIATVISQGVSAVMVMYYILFRAKYVRLRPKYMKLNFPLIGRMFALGSSSFVNQITISIINIVLNNALKHYGTASAFGSEIPIAAMGIVMKINSIMISTILGIAIGCQPILGFNYGAKNYGRVRHTLKTAVTVAFSISLVANILFVAFPQVFIGIFGDQSEMFNTFAAMALRTYLCCVFAAGIQIPCSNYFQATGRPIISMILTLLRQILVLVPLILILPRFFGLEGILYAMPITDIVALTVTLIFVFREMRTLPKTDVGSAAA